ncbi:MAG: glycine betaine/L-proline ABC transporter substrate-binding protein ProX [Chloroflexaceae bacterium]
MNYFRFSALSSLFILITIVLSACGFFGAGEATPEPSEPPTAVAQVPTTTPESTDTPEPTEVAQEQTAAPESNADPTDMTVRMARANWDTGWFQAEIYTQLLEELGFEVTEAEVLSPADFYPAVAEGTVDMWPNGWFPLHNPELQAEEVAEHVTPIGSEVRGGALQGYLIDKATAEAAGIDNLADLQDPEVAALFDNDNDGKADLLGCNAGWGCEAVINHHLDAYELGATVTHVQGEYSDLILEGIDRYAEGEPLLFYTWTPNWPINELVPGEDVVWIEVPFSSLPEGMQAQAELTLVPDVVGCSSNPCNLGFPLNDIRVVANRAFLENHPAALRLLELVEIPLDDIAAQNSTMFFGEDSPEDIERQAERWIAQNDARVSEWLATARDWEADLSTLERVQQRGELRCGVQEDLPGFATPQGDSYSGFNADFCRAVAAAALGDLDAVTFVPLSNQERFAAVSDREIDVLFHNVAWLAQRDAGMNPPNSGIRLAFGPTIFHDGQRFMVKRDEGIVTLEDLANRTICVLAGSDTEQNLQDQFAARNIPFELNRQNTAAEVYDIYERGGCDAVTADTSELVARRTRFVNPDDHTILSGQISREPHSPVYIEGDPKWADVVNWTVFVTIYAEELGINAANVEEQRNADNPDIARLLGERGNIGQELGLENDFAYTILSAVGNYRDIYVNNIDPEVLPRGPNKTWNSPEGPGGLLSASPFR